MYRPAPMGDSHAPGFCDAALRKASAVSSRTPRARE